MAEHEFTTEQLFEQAQGNATAAILGAIAYLKEQGQAPEEWIAFMGKRLAPGWAEVKGQGAKAAMRYVVMNGLSIGGNLLSLTGDEMHAEAVITDWPSDETLEFIGLTREDVDPLLAIYDPIAAYLNLRYEAQRTGSQVTYRISQ